MNLQKNENSKQLTNYKISISALAVYFAIFTMPLLMYCAKDEILSKSQASQNPQIEEIPLQVSLNEMERMSIIESSDEVKIAVYDEKIIVNQNGEIDGAGAFALLYIKKDYIDKDYLGDKNFSFKHSKDDTFCKLEYASYLDFGAYGARLAAINTPISASVSKTKDGEYAVKISYANGYNSNCELSFKGSCEQELFYDDKHINFDVSVKTFHSILLNSGF